MDSILQSKNIDWKGRLNKTTTSCLVKCISLARIEKDSPSKGAQKEAVVAVLICEKIVQTN
jgi:hypothetical protein